ncbi:PorP/SprF family type IX secretion system membrane protein [Aquimarina agarivorans]|uniref:PorP/SprF family type IX secretion system membrane protein n=1 Tax=Aquimarina agarivorans TaxID=980584 RepID=UPI000248EA99|nr:type IX secretion system membrane protein PorP/SprF [Aquimarina agarivorans]
MRFSIFFIIALVFCTVATAQQEPQYSQYLYNMSTVNPAYVKGQAGLFSSGILYRKQWQGIEGAPETANIFGSIPFGEKIEMSVNYVHDAIGDAIQVRNDFLNVDFAYITNLSESLRLSYGLKAGINSFKLNALGSDVASDPAFQDNTSQLNMSIGAGVYLFDSNFYAGVSSPNLLPSDATLNTIKVTQTAIHLYGVFGYVFDISDSVKLKPSTVIKQVVGAPVTFDISANTLIYNRFEVGASYRYQDAFVGLLGFKITPDLRIGYAYDFSLSNLSSTSNGSHEIMLLFDFDLLHLGNKYTSPRFF